MNNKIDLHMHTIASDATDTVEQLLEKIQNSGIQTFSITDHDTIISSQAMETLVPDDLHFIRGVEFSCITPFKKCHILGYGYDPADEEFQSALQLVYDLRKAKVACRIAYMEDVLNIKLTEEELAVLHSQASPGKPNFARIVVNRGLAPDIRTAIAEYINPCKTPADGIDAEIAVKGIIHAGGIPVWAHPLGGEGERRLSEEEFQIQLKDLLADGIQGLECFYSRYTLDEIEFLIEQAKIHNLLISAGSDYHGANKANINPGKLNTDNLPIDTDRVSLIQALK